MSVARIAIRLAAVAGIAAILGACAAPVQPQSSGLGSIVEARAIDVMGKLTVHRGAANAAELEGAAAEQTICGCQGIEYVVRLDSGVTMTIAQELRARERQMAIGERVLIRIDGEEKRVLPAPNV
jgi:outer membrane lipoprotein SlyB